MQKKFWDKKGDVAKSLRTALGVLITQKEYGYSDKETVLQIQENPYLQFFGGVPTYQYERLFNATLMVNFRKRLDETTLNQWKRIIKN